MTLLVYNTFVNWIRDMSNTLFAVIMAVVFIACLLIFKSFIEANTKKDGTGVAKVGLLLIVIIFLLIAIFLAGIR